MVFGDLSKISLGAAAGVVAERGGYVSALSDKARASGFDAAGDLLAAPPPALASVAASATSFADPSEFAFPTTLPELQDRVVAGLSAARELMREYLPAELAALGGAAAPSPADASTADASSLLVPLCFLAGAGTAAAVYYYGPERCRLAMDAATAKTKRALEARWKRVKAFLGPGFDDALVRATALVVAAKAAVAALPSHPRVVAWRDAAETFARETAAPKARDLYAEVASAAFAGIELAEEGAKAVVKKSVDVAKPALAKTLELAKPHWEKAVAALRPKIEAAIEYLERAFSALGGEK
jgi:hypothetical protein